MESNRFPQVYLTQNFRIFVFFAKNRWIKSLENGEYSKKYDLKQVAFEGRALKKVKKYSFFFVSTLQNIGIDKDKDQKRILKHIEKLIEKYPDKKKQKIDKKKKQILKFSSNQKKNDGENPETDSSEGNPVSDESSSSSESDINEYPE